MLRGQLALGVSGGGRTPSAPAPPVLWLQHRGGPVSWAARHTEGAKELTLAAGQWLCEGTGTREANTAAAGGEKAGGSCCHAPVWGFTCLWSRRLKKAPLPSQVSCHAVSPSPEWTQLLAAGRGPSTSSTVDWRLHTNNSLTT